MNRNVLLAVLQAVCVTADCWAFGGDPSAGVSAAIEGPESAMAPSTAGGAPPDRSSERHSQKGGPCVGGWAVGVTTAPRRCPTLEQCLSSLAQAGWEQPRLFAEPATEIPAAFSHRPIARRDAVLGAFPNWYLALAEMVMRAPHADAYFLCQDDAVFSKGLRGYLEGTLWPDAGVGVVSVYCPSHYAVDRPAGFHREDRGWGSWGALGYIFPNRSARAVLTDRGVVGHRHHGPAQGLRNIDSVLGHFCRRNGLAYYVHVPSLAQHIGRTSTIWRYGGARGRRRAHRFLSDANELGSC